jgi:hypothetical protein
MGRGRAALFKQVEGSAPDGAVWDRPVATAAAVHRQVRLGEAIARVFRLRGAVELNVADVVPLAYATPPSSHTHTHMYAHIRICIHINVIHTPTFPLGWQRLPTAPSLYTRTCLRDAM